MCTVTFVTGKNGYALGMNRDEKLSRPAALPIAIHRLSGRNALFPSEVSGGAWIGVNDAGASFALINWYRVPNRVEGQPVSRGEIVRTALALDSPELMSNPPGLDLHRVNPFRLLGVFLAQNAVYEWRWDLHNFERIAHRWETNAWFSSGFDEPGAQRARGGAFRAALHETAAGSLSWLRRLHASHLPECGPYSVCMHRSDAATVSYSEIEVDQGAANMRYVAGAPCGNGVSSKGQLSLQL
jgi:hypothetical protein